ncbi:MAG: hypothetical protein JW924_03170 [Fusobacteriaceae bacterium]|nr:hypothetical protein [Fusobacteriaceae bacterium]
MILKKIILHNFKQFAKNHEFLFSKINFVKGKNGIGKSNLTRKSIEFLLYGYTGKEKLTEQPTQGESKSCWVEGELTYQGDNYIIKRAFPTNLTITKKEEEVGLEWTSQAKEEYIKKLFKDITYFKQFRIADAYDKESNFLEQGEKVIKKILLSISADKINNIRQRSLDIKRDMERYNKDEALIYAHFPSKKRFSVLKEGLATLARKEAKIEAEIARIRGLQGRYSSKLDEIKGQLAIKTKHLANAKKYPTCYACRQPIPKEQRLRTIKEKRQEALALQEEGNAIVPKINLMTKNIAKGQKRAEKLAERQFKLQSLISRLEVRFQQKEYKYTYKDIEVAKKAIKYIDLFTSHYLVNRISVLEPIINSVLSKINHTVKFDVNDKGKFDMILTDDKNREWKYYQLSSGQELLLQIALKFALLIERGEEGLIIADEGLGSLDDDNLLHVIKLIDTLPFQLIMILHRFDNIPKTVKTIDLNEYFETMPKL